TLAANQKYLLVPAATNTAATVLNPNSAGNKNVFWNGVACVGGELRVNVHAILEYDGMQFNIISSVYVPKLATVQASTSGTTIDFTGIPSWVKKITLMLD